MHHLSKYMTYLSIKVEFDPYLSLFFIGNKKLKKIWFKKNVRVICCQCRSILSRRNTGKSKYFCLQFRICRTMPFGIIFSSHFFLFLFFFFFIILEHGLYFNISSFLLLLWPCFVCAFLYFISEEKKYDLWYVWEIFSVWMTDDYGCWCSVRRKLNEI